MASGDPGSRGARRRRNRGGQRLSTETKDSYQTSELIIWALVTVGILLAGYLIEADEGVRDVLRADKVWLFITILSSAYFISRGLAKSGSREPYDDAANQ